MSDKSRARTLFHGTRLKFGEFDPKMRHSGEGFGEYQGWSFARDLKGAHNHCEKWLGGKGSFVCICEIKERYLDKDIEKGGHEPYYGEAVDGVRYVHSEKIRILQFISYEETVENLFPFIDQVGI